MTSILLAVDHDAEASPAVRLAAQELRRLLLATTGRSVAILDAANGTDHKLALTVDPSLTDESGSERDAIAIATTGATGTISGSNPRSLLIAVYRFLTELGCRFVRPGPEGEHLPPIDLDTATVTVRERAAHQHRGVCIEGATSLTNVLDLIEWLPKVGMNSYFIQFESPHVFLRAWYERVRDPAPAPGLEYPITERTAAVHAAVTGAIAERDLIHHAVGHGWTSEVIGIRADGWGRVEGVEFRRELVAEVAGKRELWGGVPLNTELCYSQPEVRTAMATVIAEHARAHPEIDVLHVWLSDGSNNHCECADCSTARPADWYLMLLNELDRMLTETSTSTTIAFLAYHQLLWPPLTETIDNPDRFVLMFAPISRDPRVPMSEGTGGELSPYQGNDTPRPGTNAEFVDLLRGWRERWPGSSFDFDYHLMWQHCFDPGQLQIARAIHGDIRAMPSNGLDGLISCQSQRVFADGGFAMAVMARTLWDRDVEFDAILTDHATAVFGPAGAEALAHLQRLSDAVAAWDLDRRLLRQPRVVPAEIDQVRGELALVAGLAAQHAADPGIWAISWQHLGFMIRIWQGLCDVWEAVSIGDREAAEQQWSAVTELIWQEQDRHQGVFDAQNFCGTIGAQYLPRLLAEPKPYAGSRDQAATL